MLPECDKNDCDRPLTLQECTQALSELKNNKAPGCDGDPVEFYKIFWGKIKQFVYGGFMWSFQNKLLSNDQKRGVITPGSEKKEKFVSVKKLASRELIEC